MVLDPTLQCTMAAVLRLRSERLSRPCSWCMQRDIPKIEWIAGTFTNNSVLTKFSAIVMRNPASFADDPEVLTAAAVDSIVLSAMAATNAFATTEAADLAVDTTWWVEQSFEPFEQQNCVERVTAWTQRRACRLGRIAGVPTLVGSACAATL